MAKALDDLHALGLDLLMSSLALEAIRQHALDTRFLHFDTTTLSFYGAYEREGLSYLSDGINPPPKVTHGHSKAKRADLKQVVFGSLVTADGGVPLLGKLMDGNLADSLAAAEFFGRVGELVSDLRSVCLVADSKGWCDRTLAVVDGAGMRLLSRLPCSGDADMIDRYRLQYHCEHGFAWLKSGADINPMFIESPKRIAAMGLIYCVGLMTWNLIQRTVRAHLVATGSGLPYHRKKTSANITTRFLFELFPSVHTLVIDHGNGGREKQTLGLEHWQVKACEALGASPDAFKPVMSRVSGIIRLTPGLCVSSCASQPCVC